MLRPVVPTVPPGARCADPERRPYPGRHLGRTDARTAPSVLPTGRRCQGLADLGPIAITSARLRERDRLSATVAERERIARELHDSLAQVLGVTHLRLRAARRRTRRSSERRRERARSTSSRTSRRKRTMTSARPSWGCARRATSIAGLTASLAAYLEKFSRQSGIAVRWTRAAAIDPDLPPHERDPGHPRHPGGAHERPQARRAPQASVRGHRGRGRHHRSRSRTTGAASTLRRAHRARRRVRAADHARADRAGGRHALGRLGRRAAGTRIAGPHPARRRRARSAEGECPMQPKPPLRVLLADDQPLFRTALAT